MTINLVGHEVPVFRAAIATIIALIGIIQALVTYDYTQEKSLNNDQQDAIVEQGKFTAAQIEWMKAVNGRLVTIDSKLIHIDNRIDDLLRRPGPVQPRSTSGLATSKEIIELRADVKRLYDYLAPQRNE